MARELGLNRQEHMLRTCISYFTKLTNIHQFVSFHGLNAFLVKENLFVKAFDRLSKHKGMSRTWRSQVSIKW